MRPAWRFGFLMVIVLGVLAGFASVCQAAAEKTAEAPNPIAIAADTAIWAIVIFVLLLIILRKLAWGPMLEGLKKREDSIRQAAEEAKNVREESRRAIVDLQAKLDQAYAEIPKIMDEARRDAEALKEDMRNTAAKEIQTERTRLRREIDTARDQALHDIWNQAANLATAISSKVLNKTMTSDDHNRLLHQALEEMKGSTDRYRNEFLKN